MTKPVIILGAGASFDYVGEEPKHIGATWAWWKPPLTKDLCDTHQKWHTLLSKNYEISGLSSELKRRLGSSNGKSFEEHLTELSTIALKNEMRQKEIIAFEFYLHELFRNISEQHYYATNNYRALIGLILERMGGATIVTFNYDTLFEQSMTGLNEFLSSFIKGAIKLIKLHGSCDWVYAFSGNNAFRNAHDVGDSYNFLMEEPYYFTQNPNARVLHPERKGDFKESRDGKTLYFCPAIAIPLQGKDSFICPPEHISVLRESLRNTDKILIIGWKVGDPHLLRVMQDEISKPIDVLIVSSNLKNALEIKNMLGGNQMFRIKASDSAGFSKFMYSNDCESFFSS